MPRLFRTLVLFVAVAGAVVSACAGDEENPILDPSDLEAPSGEEGAEKIDFKKSRLIDDAELVDYEAVSREGLQEFFRITPYERPTFLETYQSNGVRAAEAVINAARQHKMNPIILLAYAQASQGLVGARTYPFPPERVEYVFGCGVLDARRYEPSLAGFDRQIDCLGRQLRDALDQVRNTGKTASGWSTDGTQETLDGEKVSPENWATAALYERTPRVARGEAGGVWVVWNIYNRYKNKLQYGGPTAQGEGRWVGEACNSSSQCSNEIEGVICADGESYPEGFCTAECTADTGCPVGGGRPETFCAKFTEGSFCMPVCNRGAPNCRPGYECKLSPGAAGDQKDVCAPAGQAQK